MQRNDGTLAGGGAGNVKLLGSAPSSQVRAYSPCGHMDCPPKLTARITSGLRVQRVSVALKKGL